MFLPVLRDVESCIPGTGFSVSLAFKPLGIQRLLDLLLLLQRNTLSVKFIELLLHGSLDGGSVFGQSLLQCGKLALVQPEFDRNRVQLHHLLAHRSRRIDRSAGLAFDAGAWRFSRFLHALDILTGLSRNILFVEPGEKILQLRFQSRFLLLCIEPERPQLFRFHVDADTCFFIYILLT